MTDSITDALRARAADPPLRIGRGTLPATLRALPRGWALVTQVEPLAHLDPALLAAAGATTHLVDSLTIDALDRLVAALPQASAPVVGLGGGLALDAAKWCAWRTGRSLILVPGVVSVDAAVTNTVAVREARGIVYRGFVVAEAIVLDPDFVTRAPARLNRAGVGDLLSIHTGLHDWRLGAAAGTITFDDEIASAAAAILDRMEALAPQIGASSDAGLEGVLRAYAEVNALCLRAGHSGPEEGSEHYFGYRLERVVGRSFVHGELIGLGTVLMATLQGNDPDRPRRILDTCRVEWSPTALGVEDAALRQALVGLPAFVRAQGLPHSIIDEADLGPASVDAFLARALGPALHATPA
jgi:glycerol-1-phosphate dehydrogenase [NAD(P)+]